LVVSLVSHLVKFDQLQDKLLKVYGQNSIIFLEITHLAVVAFKEDTLGVCLQQSLAAKW
jgi:hypothetical protein